MLAFSSQSFPADLLAPVGKQAILDNQAEVKDEAELERELEAEIWEPEYVPYVKKA